MSHEDSFKLILASSSSYRAKLLERFNIPFETQSPCIDEQPLTNEAPFEYVQRMSETKARVVGQQAKSSWVIGSDQTALFEHSIIGKPHNKQNAIEQLTQFSGKQVSFITGVNLLNIDQSFNEYMFSITQVKFKTLSQDKIIRYLNADKPYDCAGSFKVESLGVLLFDYISTEDPTGLEGLPLITLGKLFDRARIDVLKFS